MAQDGSEFARGAIKHIKLTDFMSFVGTLVLEAFPRVNLVVGPNTSGKSSITAAICVGLAGPLKALGRVTSIDMCIRNDSAAFELEITLSGGRGNPDIVVYRRTERVSASSRSRRRRRIGASGEAAAVDDGDDDNGGDGDDGGAGGGGGGTRSDAPFQSVHSVWRLNGHPVTEARVKQLTHELGIDFNNPCQFLPQERVQEFSRQSPTQVLESTEAAIGDGNLLVQHKGLIKLSSEIKTKREELQRVRDRLARVEAEQEANEPEYKRLERKNNLRREVVQLRLKLLWVIREGLARTVEADRAMETSEQRKVEAARKQLQEAQTVLSTRSGDIQAARRSAELMARAAEDKDAQVARGLGLLNSHMEACRAIEEQLNGLESKSRAWDADVAKFQEDLRAVREQRASLPTELSHAQVQRMQQIGLELQQLAGEVTETKLKHRQKQAELRQLDEDIRAIEDAARRRLDRRERLLRKLEYGFPGTRQFYDWIVQTRQRGGFRRRVLGPLLLEVLPIQNSDWAAYLEMAVTSKNLAAVAVEDIEDNNMVQDWLYQQQQRAGHGRRNNGRGNAPEPFSNQVLFKQPPHGSIGYPDGAASRYAQYGITHTLDQVFEATSDLVKLVLVDQCSINRTFVGSSLTDQSAVMNQLLRETSVRRIFTPGRSTSAAVSIYDHTYMIQRLEDVRPAKLLNESADTGNEQAEQLQLQQLRTARDGASAEVGRLEAELQAQKSAEKALEDEGKGLRDLKKGIESRILCLQQKEAEIDRRLQRLLQEGRPAEGREVLRADLRRNADALMRQAAAVAGCMQQQHAAHCNLAAAEAAAAAAAAVLAPLHQAVRRAQEGVRAAESALAAVKKGVAQARERLREADAHVTEEMGPRGPSAELRAAWAPWPEEQSALQDLLESKEVEVEQARAALRGDEAMVLGDWARRKAEMAELRHKAAADSSALEAAVADMQARKAAWLPELQRHVAAISESVQRHFGAIGCAGEVFLRDGGDSFDDFAIEIRVRYRPSEPFRLLDRNHHSGGERAVATMIYLMALQGVTSTPFRVVDEINQGMDSRNERKVFNQLVECSSLRDTPQCFLMTPKLIANLRFNDHVRVQNLTFINRDGLDIAPADLTRLCAEARRAEAEAAAERGAAGGSGGGGSGGGGSCDDRQAQRLRPGAASGVGMGQLPWHLTKDVLFYGRT